MNRGLIVYSSKHGTTEKCVKMLETKLSGNVDVCNLKTGKPGTLAEYDSVMIGTGIYAGQMIKEVKDFCLQNGAALKGKKVGLFTCAMSEGDKAIAQMETAFPKELLDQAAVKEWFGGELIMNKMNFFERIIIRLITKQKNDMSNIQEGRIQDFAGKISL